MPRKTKCNYASASLSLKLPHRDKSTPAVLVQREMERGRSQVVSIPPFWRGFSRHRGLPIRCGSWKRAPAKAPRLLIVPMSSLDYPSVWLRSRSAASVSPSKFIVASPRLAPPTSGCAVIPSQCAS